MSRSPFSYPVAVLMLVVSALAAAAQNTKYPPLPPFHMPESVVVRKVDIYSEGTRMSGQFYSDKKYDGKKLPTIIMAHGWGGFASYLVRDAAAFAEAGYLVLTFDYRGWGPSDSRLVLTGKTEPSGVQGGKLTAEVQEVREIAAPLDMVVDWQNAIDFAVGDSQCDKDRIGLWGSSLSGGLVVSAAERDTRVKVIHSQVPTLDGRWTLTLPSLHDVTLNDATQRAKYDTPYPPPGSNTIANLIGAPILQQFASWFPVEDINQIQKVPIQFVLAGSDELVDNKANGLRAYDMFKGTKNLVVVPGIQHYGIYNLIDVRNEAIQLAITWYDKYLKSPASLATN